MAVSVEPNLRDSGDNSLKLGSSMSLTSAPGGEGGATKAFGALAEVERPEAKVRNAIGDQKIIDQVEKFVQHQQ